LFGPGGESGTFDYFTLAVVGTARSSRTDYTRSEDDNVLVDGVATDVNALGYFGAAYYLANREKLRLVAIDNGRGCVTPSMQTVEVPLSTASLLLVSRRLDRNLTGSIFKGRGSVVGVRLNFVENEDRVKNALVQ
jgi:phosphate transport system substrate-binding protein